MPQTSRCAPAPPSWRIGTDAPMDAQAASTLLEGTPTSHPEQPQSGCHVEQRQPRTRRPSLWRRRARAREAAQSEGRRVRQLMDITSVSAGHQPPCSKAHPSHPEQPQRGGEQGLERRPNPKGGVCVAARRCCAVRWGHVCRWGGGGVRLLVGREWEGMAKRTPIGAEGTCVPPPLRRLCVCVCVCGRPRRIGERWRCPFTAVQGVRVRVASSAATSAGLCGRWGCAVGVAACSASLAARRRCLLGVASPRACSAGEGVVGRHGESQGVSMVGGDVVKWVACPASLCRVGPLGSLSVRSSRLASPPCTAARSARVGAYAWAVLERGRLRRYEEARASVARGACRKGAEEDWLGVGDAPCGRRRGVCVVVRWGGGGCGEGEEQGREKSAKGVRGGKPRPGKGRDSERASRCALHCCLPAAVCGFGWRPGEGPVKGGCNRGRRRAVPRAWGRQK